MSEIEFKYHDPGTPFIFFEEYAEPFRVLTTTFEKMERHGPALVSQKPLEEIGSLVSVKRKIDSRSWKPRPNLDNLGNEMTIVLGEFSKNVWRLENMILLTVGPNWLQKALPQSIIEILIMFTTRCSKSWRDVFYSSVHECWLIVRHENVVKAEWLEGRIAE